MTASYGMLRENSRRAPSPCTIAVPLREAWTADAWSLIEIGYASVPYAPAFVQDGIVLVTQRARTVALNAADGAPVWTCPWPGEAHLIHQGRVFLWHGADEIHVLDARSGVPEVVLFGPDCSDALAIGNHLIGWGSRYEYGGEHVWAITWTSGQRLWTTHLPGNLRISGSPCASETRVIYCVQKSGGESEKSDPTLIACDVLTGDEVWRRPQSLLTGVASILDGCVLACVGTTTMALSIADGSVVWETEAGDGYLYGDRYYCVEPSSGRCTVLEGRSGGKMSEWDLGARLPEEFQNDGPFAVCLVTESHIFVAARSGALLAFTRDRGKFVWRHRGEGAQRPSDVACAGGRLYYKNGTHQLICLESSG